MVVVAVVVVVVVVVVEWIAASFADVDVVDEVGESPLV